MCDKADMLLGGLLLGGGIAAMMAVGTHSSVKLEDGQSGSLLRDLFAERPHIRTDGMLSMYLSTCGPLWVQVDMDTTRSLFDACEGLLRAYATVQRGDRRTNLVADVLAYRRSATAAISSLTTQCRRARPMEASDVSSESELLLKALQDIVHNTTQQSSLNLLQPA